MSPVKYNLRRLCKHSWSKNAGASYSLSLLLRTRVYDSTTFLLPLLWWNLVADRHKVHITVLIVCRGN